MLRAPSTLAIAIGCALGVQASWSVAAEWTTTAAVAPRVVYSDNVCLNDQNEQDEIYGVITPSFGIEGKGNRANVSLLASVDASTLSDGDLRDNGCSNARGDLDRDDYLPDVRARADATLVDQWLYLDVRGTATQNDVNPFVAGGDDVADRRGNVNTTYRYTVSPYIKRRLKDVADVTLRYTYDDQTNSKDSVSDSTEESANLLISSGPSASPISWGLQGDYSNVEFDETDTRQFDDESELKSAQLNLGYQITRQWQVNGYYGEEWNDFVSDRDDIDGDYWSAGLTWTPNERATFSAGTGDRFFGTTPYFRADYRHKRSRFTVNYEQTLTYSRNVRTLGVDDGLGGQPTSLTDSPILDERVTLGYRFTGRRFNFGVTGNYSDQTREGSNGFVGSEFDIDEARYTGVLVNADRSLAQNLTARVAMGWREEEPKGEGSNFIAESETWRVGLGLDRDFTDRFTASVQYDYIDRQSDISLDEYQENRITFSVRIDLL
ncbi:MAG: TIGR03016 family PEP-CTERM system-associated outer membrane protein [Halioglobus sp.]